MGRIVLGMSVSLDGIAGSSNLEVPGESMAVHEAILGWQFPLRSWQEHQGMPGGEDTEESRLWEEDFSRWGAQVVGRRMFDFGNPHWGENPPFRVPVVVNTHRPEAQMEKLGGTTYIFVTGGIEESVRRARELAGDRDVLIAGGVQLARQALEAGLVDELALHVAHVVLGHGERFFDAVAMPLRLRPIRTVAGAGATHVSYDVLR